MLVLIIITIILSRSLHDIIITVEYVAKKGKELLEKIPTVAYIGIGALALGMLAGKHFLTPQTTTATSVSGVARSANNKQAFVLLVTITFPNVEEKERFKKIFRPMASYVASQEYSTLSYEVAESDKDDRQVVVIER